MAPTNTSTPRQGLVLVAVGLALVGQQLTNSPRQAAIGWVLLGASCLLFVIAARPATPATEPIRWEAGAFGWLGLVSIIAAVAAIALTTWLTSTKTWSL